MNNEAFETWKRENWPDGCIVPILYGRGANIERPLEDAFNAGYKAKEAEPLPAIAQGLIDGQNNIIQKQRELIIWHTEEPPRDKRIELLCVLFDEDEYRTLKKNSWNNEYNRFIITGTWNGAYFRGGHHNPGDPFPKVVAWRPIEENMGAPFYTKCLGECRD